MFFVKDLEDRIELHPSYFNCDAARHIRERLYEKVEGTNTGSMMIIAVIKIDEVSEPKIAPGRGVALYDISYQAVVWRPFRGEVVDGLVSSVVTNGFFVDVCGLSVFVSRAMIPSTMQYTVEGSTPNFSDSDGMTVERGSQVRLRIKGIRGEMGQMYAIGMCAVQDSPVRPLREYAELTSPQAALKKIISELCYNRSGSNTAAVWYV